MGIVWREFLNELRQPPLIGPGLRTNLFPPLRMGLHFLFITFRYLGFYLIFKPIAWLILTSVTNLKIKDRQNIPISGPFMGTCNHLSNFDPLLGAFCSRRPLFSMAKAEYFGTPVLGGIVIALGGFPVRRGEADRQAVRTALALYRQGSSILAIFPEGTRSKTFKLQPAQPGAALLASSTAALVVPTSISGTENIMRRHKLGFLSRPRVEIAIGQPYKLKEEAAAFALKYNLEMNAKRGRHHDLEFLSDIMMLKIAENLPPDYRGEFTPEGVVQRFKDRLARKEASPKENPR